MNDLPPGITVDIQQIADIAGVGRSAVGNWRKRHADFPVPDAGNRFDLREVERWLIENGKIDNPVPPEYIAWSLADALRGALDADDTASLLIAVLVYLHVSAQSSRPRRRHTVELDIPESATWRRVRETAPDGLITALLDAAQTIEHANPLLAGLLVPGLSNASRVGEKLVHQLIDSFDRAADEDVTPRYALFEGVVGRAGELDRFRGEFATPHDVTELMVRLGGWRTGTVFDPACGQGGLLLSTAIHPDRDASGRVRLVGYEINPDVLRVARSRFFLYGVAADLRQGDVFRVPVDRLPKADLVLVDPPLGVRDWGDAEIYLDQRWSYGIPPRRNGDLAWVQLAVQALADDGRAVVVTTTASTYGGGAAAQIRWRMVEAGVVHAVVQLPSRLRANTSVPLALWILQAPNAATRNVLFIDASTLGTTGRSRHTFDEPDFERIVSAVEAHEDGAMPDPSIAWAVDSREIIAHDAVLEPTRYRPVPGIDLDEVRRRADELRSLLPAATDTAADAVKRLLAGLGEVRR